MGEAACGIMQSRHKLATLKMKASLILHSWSYLTLTEHVLRCRLSNQAVATMQPQLPQTGGVV